MNFTSSGFLSSFSVKRFSTQLILLLLLCLGYTVVRYVFFGPVDPVHIPTFLINKAVSFGSVLCLPLAAWAQIKNGSGKNWGKAAIILAGLHILLSFTILNPETFPKFHEANSGKLNWKGELIFLFGSLGAIGFWGANQLRSESKKRDCIVWLTSLALCLHIVWMGIPGWAQPEKWHGGLPPISLLSFLATVIATIFYLRIYRAK